jgi:uncharacterized membrane protein YkoI
MLIRLSAEAIFASTPTMKTNTILLAAGTSLLLLANACGGGNGAPAAEPSVTTTTAGEIDVETAKQRASAVVPGAVADARKKDEAAEHSWEVSMKMPNGADVMVEVDRMKGSIKEIKGKQGPFEYDFSPGNGYMKFADAKTKALAAKPGELQEWELETDDEEYEMVVRGTDGKMYEITLDAKSGEVKKTKEK